MVCYILSLHGIAKLVTFTLIALFMMKAATPVPLTMKTAPNTTKPGCPRQCGNLTVPYPFGIGLGSGCSLSPWYDINCVTSYDPPRAFSPIITDTFAVMIQVLDISDTQIRIRNQMVAYHCFNSTGGETDWMSWFSRMVKQGAPYSLSPSHNTLTTVGCNDNGSVRGSTTDPLLAQPDSVSCSTNCTSRESVVGGPCTGTNGCCQSIIPKSSRFYTVRVDTSFFGNNHTFISSWNPCGYAFIGEVGSFRFRGAADLNDSGFVDRVKATVPIVLDWVISDQKCSQAQKNPATYACGKGNIECIDGNTGIGGYRCSCSPGYEGNPYLDHGCTDINECADEHNSPCSLKCENTRGSYKCSCPAGYTGDGRKDGDGCFPTTPVSLATVIGVAVLIICSIWISKKARETMLRKRRDKFFQQNGGHLLKQLLASSNAESAKIFTVEELAAATNNFHEDCVIGKGGQGMVYKGILPGNQVVAIKKSKLMDDSQIEQFVNELVILTRTHHPNVVKLLGCCLEDEVPLLVYEFIPNGTLHDHIHARGGASLLSWPECLRIAAECAKALAYLHSVPVIHRDVKSTNILLDDDNVAKISDFGISKLIPVGRTRMSTLVHGTLGYLDPEYFLSSQLTSKSDVYGFGVVLVELITRQEAILTDETDMEQRNLSVYFLKAMEAGRLDQVIDHELAKEVSQDQLIILGELIHSCLSMSGKSRPTMTEVAIVLEELCILQECEGIESDLHLQKDDAT